MHRILALSVLATSLATAQTTLFSDTFDRATTGVYDSNATQGALDASLTGITDNTGSALVAGGVYARPFTAGGSGILNNELLLASGNGSSNLYINHNFTNQSILDNGGFMVSLDLTAINQDTAGQGAGFGIGMKQADANLAGDARNGASKMQDAFDASGNTDTNISVASFWLVLRASGELVWGDYGDSVADNAADTLLGNVNVGSKTGTISAIFRNFSNFDAGTTVDVEVFFNGASQGTSTFVWANTDANFIGIDARDNDGVTFDNLLVALPPPTQPTATLEVSPGFVAPDDISKSVTLSWSGDNLPAGTTYEITADQTVTFPNLDSTGSASPNSGSVEAVVNGSLGNTTFTLRFLDGATELASDSATVRQQRPNVILIMTDDMGFSDFGCYGSEIHTPAVDSLAANGLRYRNFYNTARCSTTRCALLTGLYTHQVAENPGASLPDLRTDNNVTIPELLSTNGYRRYMGGKWHVGTNDRSPVSRGFQHVFGQKSGGNFPHNQVSGGNQQSFWDEGNFGFYSENDEVAVIDYPNYNLNTDTDTHPAGRFHQTDAIGDYSLEFIDHHLSKGDGSPFFLYLPFNAVHWDIDSPADMADRYTDVGDPTPDGLTTNGGLDGKDFYQYEVGWDQTRADRFERQLALGVRDASWTLSDKSVTINPNGTLDEIPDWDQVDGGAARRADLARRMALYSAMLEQVDNNVAKVVDKLTDEGLLENTIIVIIADNGGNYEGGLYGRTDGTSNAAPVTGFSALRNMGQPSNPDLHLGGGWANVNNTPFRLYKHYQHEGGIRSPCIVHWPAGITSPGRWIEDRGHLIDIMATISDVTSTPYPATWPGRDILPLEGQSLTPHFSPATVSSFPARGIGFEHESNRAWFKGNYKFVTKNFAYPDGSSSQDELELYDLTVDPTETNNLAASEPELLAEMLNDWNAWATRVGVLPNRLLLPPSPQYNPAPLVTDLFVDTFNRPDDPDHDASADGMSGPLVPPLGAGTTYWDSWEAGATNVANLALQMAVGSGMTETAIKHNFIDPAILSAGGFSVQIRLDNIDSALGADRFAGIAVGLGSAEAQDGDDIGNGGNPAGVSFRGSSDGSTPGSADFFIEIDKDQNLKMFSNGTPLDSIPVGKSSGNLLVCFELVSFAAGSPVTVTAFLDGQEIDLDSSSSATTRSFTWDNSDSNYIGLSARASTSVTLDNLAVRTLPLSAALANNHALAAGLSGSKSALDQDPDHDGDNNFMEWLKAGDPKVPDAGSKLLMLSPSPTGEFHFNYVQLNDPQKAGLTYTFRYSTDLAGDPSTWPTFTPEPISVAPLGTTHQLKMVRVPASLITSNSRLFILIQIE